MNNEAILKTFTDVTLWCESYLRDPRDREKPLLLRSYQAEITDNSRTQQNIILRWGRRMGKCLSGKSKILNNLGERVRVDSLVNTTRFGVISLDDNMRFTPTYQTKCVSNGIKPLYQLLTKSGRKIEVTENHPFLTPTGWKWLKDLKPGQNISVPSSINLDIPVSSDIFDFQAKTLAYLLSDGCLTQSIRFGNELKCVQEEFKDSIKLFKGCTYRITKKQGKYEEYYIHGIKDNNGVRQQNSLLDYIRTLNLFGKNSHTKFIPNEIFRSSKRQQALFLSRLFACDGWASVSKSNRTSGNCEIGYCSVSEDLAYDVAHLLMRFGIRYFIKERNIEYKGTLKKAFQICIRTKTDILKFLDEIGIFGKEEACEKVRASVNLRIDKDTYFDSVPFELVDAFNIPTSRYIKKVNRVSKSKVLDYAEQHNMADLVQILNSDTFFDEIESIEYCGDEETFDIQADPYSNYIADDIIVHNSVVMCADCLWWASTWPIIRQMEKGDKKQHPFTALVFAPYESQVKELWNTFTQLIGDSPLLKDQVKKVRTSDVHSIEFQNGSVIKGYTIGISSSNQGTSLRGLSGDLIFIDEMDFIPTDIIEQVILPITTTHPDVIRRICSTPSGKRELYFKWCTQAEELGWLHLHYPSWHKDNDNWMSQQQAKDKGMLIQQSTEFQVKQVTAHDAYIREYGAEFGEEFGGVYKHHLISKCMSKYGRHVDVSDPDFFDPGFEQNPEHKYIIGVDWNSYINGGQIVMLEFCSTPTFINFFDDEEGQDVTVDFTGKYRIFYRRGIKSKESTQRQTRAEVLRLMTHFKVDYLYVDYGAGDTNIEELSLYGRAHPELGLNRKLRVIDSGATVEHYDHVLQKPVKKRNKSLMVNFSVLSLEEGMIALPKEEDAGTRLVGQMRSYRVKNVTTRGEFAYEGEDHILDAFNLAIYGFQQNFGQLLASRVSYSINVLPDPRASYYPQRANENTNGFISNSQINAGTFDPEYSSGFQKPRMVSKPSFGARTGKVGAPRAGGMFSTQSGSSLRSLFE